MKVNWQEILARWDIHQTQPARQSVLFAYNVGQTHDVRSADRFLEKEEQIWRQCQHRPSYIYHLVKILNEQELPVETPEEIANAMKSAVGSWLFPIEALGRLEDNLDGMKEVYDLSGHWPELLALSCLN